MAVEERQGGWMDGQKKERTGGQTEQKKGKRKERRKEGTTWACPQLCSVFKGVATTTPRKVKGGTEGRKEGREKEKKLKEGRKEGRKKRS
jgi:hypothetical protein